MTPFQRAQLELGAALMDWADEAGQRAALVLRRDPGGQVYIHGQPALTAMLRRAYEVERETETEVVG